MADDMGYECVSSNGGGPYKTPRLDALARGGIRFEHCHSQPICTPSRVQIMTGIYNNRNYLRFGLLDPKAITFGHVLKKAGYATCIVGKWQLSGGLEAPKKFGFDEYCLWQLSRRPGRYANPGLEINGKLVDYNQGEYGPDIVSDYLCDFMERNKDRPFFAYYPMILPHWPFEPTPDSPDYDKTAKSRDGARNPKYFPGMVHHVDKIVGKIDDKLRQLGIRENTVLIFTGDNGTYTGITSKLNGKPYPGGKGSTRDNGTHVPLIVSWPGTASAGKVSEALIDFSDIFPTLVELTGAKSPADIKLDGHSFAPLLRGETFKGRDYIYCWYSRNGNRGKEIQLTRDRRYKLYATGQFYDVANDIKEQQPLDVKSLSRRQEASYDRLKAALDKHTATTKQVAEEIQARKKKLSGQRRRKQTSRSK